MKSKARNLFRAKNLNLQDVSGVELDFPERNAEDYPEVGDWCIVDGEVKASGEYILGTDGTIIALSKGYVTKVTTINDDDYEEVLNKHLDKLEEELETMNRKLMLPKPLAMFRDRSKVQNFIKKHKK